ncbi:cation-translocating P-type ATPase [Formosa sp. S-31]|uniref:cation-translocating P-type ATPase n=1 Tax=Formosa sp. S-31 TaxID=2790949 RepID=UPI003EB7FFB4
MPETQFDIQGLSSAQVDQSRAEHGTNVLNYKQQNTVLDALKSLAKEPMILLLLAAAIIYFISGETGDALFLLSAIGIVSAIALYQDTTSRNALEKLKALTQPHCKVIRDGEVQSINSEALVVGDFMMIEEGTAIPADGRIVQSNDFSVNESILTGEALPVFKDSTLDNNQNVIYKGTTVVSGLAIATVSHIGNATQLGKIGKSLEDISESKTPLELQINNFVKKLVILGTLVFLIVWAINFFNSRNVLDSLLKALTLAMSILPEEIPMAFSAFMAIGAWRLMKKGILVKQMKMVETLGSTTVICSDKTGTITENRMHLAKVFTLNPPTVTVIDSELSVQAIDLITTAMWASEPIPFNPMEVALHETYAQHTTTDLRPQYSMVHEYPLEGKPPMMTHVFETRDGQRIIAAKGAAEAIMAVCNLSASDKQEVETAIQTISSSGYRILGVASSDFSSNTYPEKQQELPFNFKGLVAFYDPPKANIHSVLNQFYQAGIDVKIITGDNAATTTAIAQQIDFKGLEAHMSGEDLMKLSDAALQDQVKHTYVFTRMFPEAKLRIINALKADGQIVAMTGDGVNDGPALKAAHIGVAMGKKGTEIAKQAASLILLEDDLSKMVDAVSMGRKIYTNLKKAIQYIISIHIPIILTVFIPLALGWVYPNIFTPVHIIFLELIMGPTCSIAFENEPLEPHVMTQKPRPLSTTFFNKKELTTSILQGLAITSGTLLAYQTAVHYQCNEAQTRTIVFTVLITANIFLTLVNRSFYHSVVTTLGYKNKLIGLIIAITIGITALLLFIPPFTAFFKFETLTATQIAFSIAIGFISVIWFEGVKYVKRKKKLALNLN